MSERDAGMLIHWRPRAFMIQWKLPLEERGVVVELGVGLQKVQLQQEAMLCDPALCTHLLPEQKLADGLTWLPFACRCAEPDCNWENVIREEACPWFLVLHVGC